MSGRTGRRPGDPDVTRRAILDAARATFGEYGFERATIRRIAAAADVDPALIHHYFGSKQGLFAAAHEIPFDPTRVIAQLAAGPRSELGERVARFYLTVMGVPGSPAISLLRAAATNDAAARMLGEFIEDLLLGHAGELTDADNPRLRLALVGSHMIGVIFARSMVGVPELSEADPEVLIDIIAPVLQRYLTEPEALAGAARHRQHPAGGSRDERH